jgi:hypothetical protein
MRRLKVRVQGFRDGPLYQNRPRWKWADHFSTVAHTEYIHTMTTTISHSRRVKRESIASIHSAGKRRTIIVELDPNIPQLVGFRLKGTRTTYHLPIDYCWREACRLEVLARKRLRKEQRRLLKKGGKP